MNKKNKLWVQPELIVLVRKKPEEGILLTCKGLTKFGGLSPNENYWGCGQPWSSCTEMCSAQQNS